MKPRKPDKIRILVVDDDDKILYAFKQVLRQDGYRCSVAMNGEEALVKVASEKPELVFMDITMPGLDGLETLRQIKERNKSVPVIMITGHGTMQTAIKAIQLGAFDYLTKPLDVNKVREVTRRVLSSVDGSAVGKAALLTFKAELTDRYDLVGSSGRMQEVYKLIGSISTTPNHTSVLIIGESGTGKELVARAIHAHSSNAREPFVGINCTVLPETLLESELFGYDKGAFTGAAERKPGKFEIAGKGTIFLDEIGDLSLGLQQKLLRVLQEREFERLGGNDAIRVDGRFITATNRDIEHDVKQGKFRKDLFYRFNVVSIELPSLRERMEDVPLLANYFLSRYSVQLKKQIVGFSDDAMTLLQHHSYPGNVRELENLIERAVMLTSGDRIMPEVFRDVLESPAGKEVLLPISGSKFSKSREHILAIFEKQFLREQLKRNRGNVTTAAKVSGVTRQYFQRLMKKHKVRATDFRK